MSPRPAPLVLLVLGAGCASTAELPASVPTAGIALPTGLPADPIVVVVTLDAFRRDYVDADTTPFLAAASAAHGLRFDRHWNSSNWTWPAMTAVVTGHYLRTWGIAPVIDTMSTGLPAESTPMAEAFSAAGFLTYCNSANAVVGTLTGLTSGCAVMDKSTDTSGPLSRAQLVGGVLPWIRTNAIPGRPVFAWAHTMDTHDPYDGVLPESCRERTESALDRCPSDIRGSEFWVEAAAWTDAEQVSCDDAIDAVQRCLATGIDDALRELAEGLDTAGLTDRVVWLVTADHGENNGRVEDGVPRYLHAQTVAAPETSGFAWLSWPGAPPQDVGRASTSASLLPSLLELLDIPVPLGLDSVSAWTGSTDPATMFSCQGDVGILGVVSNDGARHLISQDGPTLYAPLDDPGEERPLDEAPSADLTEAMLAGEAQFGALCD